MPDRHLKLEQIVATVLAGQADVQQNMPYLRGFIDYAADMGDPQLIATALSVLDAMKPFEDMRDIIVHAQVLKAAGQKNAG